MVAKLEEIRVQGQDAWDAGRRDRAYAEAFREYGIDVDALGADAAAERIQASALALPLVLAVHGWSHSRRSAATNDRARNLMHEAAVRADPDPWRKQLYGACLAPDREALRKLWSERKPEEIPVELFDCLVSTVDSLHGGMHGHGAAAAGAVALYRAAQSRRPDDFWITYGLAHWLTHLDPPDYVEALRFLTAAMALRPRSTAVWYDLSSVKRELGDLEGAEEAARIAIDIAPDHAQPWNALGVALQYRDHRKAVEAYRKAIDLDGTEALYRVNLGSVLSIGLGEHEEAIRVLDGAIKIAPRLAMAHYYMGLARGYNGDVSGAIEAYRAAIAIDPKYVDARGNLGHMLLQRGEFADAIEILQEARRLAPGHAVVRHNLGLALLESGEQRAALIELEHAVACKPKDVGDLCEIGSILAKLGSIEKAIEAFEQAIAIDPGRADAHLCLGHAFDRHGDLDRAIAAYRDAIAANPHLSDARIDLGVALAKKGQSDQAYDSFVEATADPKNPRGWYSIGRWLLERHRHEDAIPALEKALAIDPDHRSSRESLAYALAEAGFVEEAIQPWKEALVRQPGDRDLRYGLGCALYRAGDLDGAIAAFEAVLKRDSDHIDAIADLGFAWQDKGEFGEALTWFRRAHELGAKKADWHHPSAQWIADCEAMAQAEARLPRVLRGEAAPSSAQECVLLARICRAKGLHREAVGFWQRAFSLDPALAEDREQRLRETAARDAALAGAWKEALSLLRDELGILRKQVQPGEVADARRVLRALTRWTNYRELAAIRGADALGRLPAAEREALQSLWDEVDELRQRAAKAAGVGTVR